MAAYRHPLLVSRPVAGRMQAWREAGPRGDRVPLVLLHGIGSNSRAWAGQFAGFADERRVLAWNAPGYAESAPLAADWPTPDEYADALGELLDHCGIDRCVLVGQSLGAVMATAFALKVPERVAALVLASPASGYGVAPGDPLPATIQQRISDIETLGPEGLAAARYARLLSATASAEAHAIVQQAMGEVTKRGYAQAAHLLAGANLPVAVAGLRVPVTTIWGSEDVITPPAGCAAVAAATPTGSHVEIAGGGHAVATEDPLQFNQALRSILNDADAYQGACP